MGQQLTELQHQILDEIKVDIKNNCDMSMKEFKNRHYVSPAFLVKLAKKCGYSGYREMIFSMKTGGNTLVPYLPDHAQDIHMAVISNYSDDLMRTFAQYMQDVRNGYIYAAGIGYSEIVIDYLCRKGVRKGYRIIYTENIEEMPSADHNVVFFVSLSGETQEIIRIAEVCRAFHYRTIAFIQNKNSRLGRMVDIPIVIANWEKQTGFDCFVSNSILAIDILLARL